MSDHIVEVKDGDQIMTLNRPEPRYAARLARWQAMVAALEARASRGDVRIGTATGAGGASCAGRDLTGCLRGQRPTVRGRGFAGITQKPPRTPVIAAVEGYA